SSSGGSDCILFLPFLLQRLRPLLVTGFSRHAYARLFLFAPSNETLCVCCHDTGLRLVPFYRRITAPLLCFRCKPVIDKIENDGSDPGKHDIPDHAFDQLSRGTHWPCRIQTEPVMRELRIWEEQGC